MSTPEIGLIGTGIMGIPMARNLQQAGYHLHLHSHTRARTGELLAAGARWHDSPAALAAAVELIITIVTDSPDVEQVYLADDGVCSSLGPGTLCLDMTTCAPEVARRVEAEVSSRNGDFLDAPVSGGKTGAEAGTLSIMVGGSPAALARARPVLQVLGKTIVHCGPTGTGQLTKACNQVICALNLLAVSEAMALARAAGLDQETMLRAVAGGAAGSWAIDNLGSRMLRRDFAPMFMIDLQQKDLRLALEAARQAHVPLPGAALVHQLLAANQAAGEGREGTQALLKTLERLASAN